MQTLRCKPGDLAIVVSAKLPQNVGQIVEVLGPQTGKPFRITDQGHVWQVRAVSGRASLHYCFEKTGRIVQEVEGPVPDCRLRPVSGVLFPEANAGTRLADATQ
jgi:hypothetical protein